MTNNPLTDAALAELDRLFAAATPGEWQVSGSHIYGPDPKRSLIAQTLDWPTNSRDAIAALHNAYPALRQRILDAESRLAEAEKALARYANGPWLVMPNEGFSAKDGSTRKRFAAFEDQGGEIAKEALAEIARWKEAHHGK